MSLLYIFPLKIQYKPLFKFLLNIIDIYLYLFLIFFISLLSCCMKHILNNYIKELSSYPDVPNVLELMNEIAT